MRAAAPRVAELDRKRKADLASRLTARWQRWELSNFDYLMQLNTLAGVAFMTMLCVILRLQHCSAVADATCCPYHASQPQAQHG